MREVVRVFQTASVRRLGTAESFKFHGVKEQRRFWPNSAAGEIRTSMEVNSGDYLVTRNGRNLTLKHLMPGKYDVRKLHPDDPNGALTTVDGSPVGRTVATRLRAIGPGHALKRALK